ncbi:MAG: peptide chain release factor 1 [Bacteroidetes bacterium]|jgi:peptide chain release factor 1|nr:peptide chain release factor 1 [Bacteroidota bacterium]
MIPKETIARVKRRFEEVNEGLASPETLSDPKRMQTLGKELTYLRTVMDGVISYEALLEEMNSLEEMITSETDVEIVRMARAELEDLEEKLPQEVEQLRFLLIPRDPEEARDAIMEIRAGTGGDEASLFAGDLYKLYQRFAEKHGLKVEIMDASYGTAGGYKEIIFSVRGDQAFGTLRFESGVHRVQRVPATESSGRIHTSAATVAVLPEAEEVDVDINPNDLRIDVYRSSGPGGQSVNTTDSAVRITHIPTGLVVAIQDEKSQHKNKDKALRVLRSRLYEMERERLEAERTEARRSMVSTGDRSAKIRTYNYPQGRVTDHRLEGDVKNHALETVMLGNLDPIIKALRLADYEARLTKA